MTLFSTEEIEFLKKEFGLTEEKIKTISKSEWAEIQDKLFDIEVEEACMAADDPAYQLPKREEIAIRLYETPLKDLGIV